jgi:hypothetical protein
MSIVHRDVKPEHFCRRWPRGPRGLRNRPIVGDPSGGGGALTTDGTVVRHLSCMSPEQARERALTAGRTSPSAACSTNSSPAPLLPRQQHGRFSASRGEAAAPRGAASPSRRLEAVVLQLLAKAPDDRPGGARKSRECSGLLRAGAPATARRQSSGQVGPSRRMSTARKTILNAPVAWRCDARCVRR